MRVNVNNHPYPCCWPECVGAARVDFPLCDTHRFTAHLAQVEHELSQQAIIKTAQRPVVYYMAQDDGNIKIGYTANLRQRVRGLRLPYEAVLAAEPGGQPLERERHLFFEHLRLGRMETFRSSTLLRAHIGTTRRKHGDPYALQGRSANVDTHWATRVPESRR